MYKLIIPLLQTCRVSQLHDFTENCLALEYELTVEGTITSCLVC